VADVKYPTGPNADTFTEDLAAAISYDPRVVAVWAKAEGAYPSPPGTGGFDYLNMVPGKEPYAGVSPGGFDLFSDVGEAVGSTTQRIETLGFYSGIRGAAKKSPLDQINAISASPWDAGHYQEHGGNTLISLFQSDYGSAALGGNPEAPTPIGPSTGGSSGGSSGGGISSSGSGCIGLPGYTVGPCAGTTPTSFTADANTNWCCVPADSINGQGTPALSGTIQNGQCCGPGIRSQGSGGQGCGPSLPLVGHIFPQSVCDFFSAITSTAFWLRAGEVLLGIVLLWIGLSRAIKGLAGPGQALGAVGRTATRVTAVAP
jgi:hypothetical protein